MKHISIKYNPYLIKTVIKVDGKEPKPNSSLNVGNKRLQEWVERLPKTLLDEYRDRNISLEFTGITSDYEDVQAAFKPYKERMSIEWSHNKTPDVTDVENTIKRIFEDIQAGPINSLKDPKIVRTFERAQNAQFEINVVATMSSGKSTLINALLGKKLMPAANEATTATIVRIIDTPNTDSYTAIAYDKSGNKRKVKEPVTLLDMKAMNDDPEISTIELRGKIPFVNSTGMRLILVDTPGPNNSRNERHREMTYQMLKGSDHSLVLYVMNAGQLGINDEKNFLDFVCDCMKEGGKQSRERFIFAVNQMDRFNVEDEGQNCIKKALDNVKDSLEERGINEPNIFPVSSLAALEKRSEGKVKMALPIFQPLSETYPAYHFDTYYDYSHLPASARNRIENFKSKAEISSDDLLEVHTGIVSIEQAIAMYINKYARTTKIRDLVHAFNEKLTELAVEARLRDAILEDENAAKEIEKQISLVQSNINSAQNAQQCTKMIDDLKLTKAKEDIRKYLDGVKNKINSMMSGKQNKVEKLQAKMQCDELKRDCEAIATQLKIQLVSIIQKAYQDNVSNLVEEYKKCLSDLNAGIEDNALAFDSLDLVATNLQDLSNIISDHEERVDESYYKTEEYEVKVPGNRGKYGSGGAADGAAVGAAIGSFIPGIGSLLGAIGGAIIGGIGGAAAGTGEHMETRTIQKKVEKYVDYIDMSEVASDYLMPFQKSLLNVQTTAEEFVDGETERLKKYLKGKLQEINGILSQKLEELKKATQKKETTASEIAKKKEELEWLREIQHRVNCIIEF